MTYSLFLPLVQQGAELLKILLLVIAKDFTEEYDKYSTILTAILNPIGKIVDHVYKDITNEFGLTGYLDPDNPAWFGNPNDV